MEPWIIFAIISALAGAGISLSSEYFNVRSLHFSFWMRFFAMLAILPFVLFIDWPEDPLYYVFVLITACIFAYFDLIYFGMAARSGAGVITRIDPFIVMVTFVLWCVFSPVTVAEYIHQPVRAAGIVASLAGSVYFGLRLRKCEVSTEVLRRMALPILLGALGIILAKMAMQRSGYHAGVLCYGFLQCLTVTCVYAAILRIPALSARLKDLGRESRLLDRPVLIGGFCGALAWLGHTLSKYYAITDVQNPAYVTVIGLSAPLWVLLAYRIAGRRDRADIISGLGVVACAAILVIFTQL